MILLLSTQLIITNSHSPAVCVLFVLYVELCVERVVVSDRTFISAEVHTTQISVNYVSFGDNEIRDKT